MLTTSDREADIVKSYAKEPARTSPNRWTLINSKTWSSSLPFIGCWWLGFVAARAEGYVSFAVEEMTTTLC